ncbi:MAG TPA: hypothetical protein DEQ14_09575, partial [Treponema sp.]|nr:hypothetical protein [Treponema sp.]
MAASFFEKLFALFSSSHDPEAAKKRRMKQLLKELTGNKYSRFYKPKTGEIEGALGKFFFEIYKVVSPAQVFLQNAPKSASLKQIVVESFFDKNMENIRNRLTEEAVEERANSGFKELGKSLNADFNALSQAFDSERIELTDRCYNNILCMAQFVSFDFFLLLKKFDPNITERNFSYQPKFTTIRGEYLSENIKDFLEVSFGVDPDQDWKTALKALKIFKDGVDVVAPDQWHKLLLLLKDVRKSGILETMIRHIDQKPDWQSLPKLPNEHIAEKYIENKRIEVKAVVDTIVNAKKNAQINVLVKTVFGESDLNRAKFYTVKAGEIYVKKNFDGFIHAPAVNYMKAFFLDYLKKEIRELCDLLLIRGQWTTIELSKSTSEHFNRLMELSDTLIAFDETLADSGENGSRLKTTIAKVERDKSQARYVTLILKTVNENAMRLIKETAISLIVVGKSLKVLAEDLQKPKHDLLMNWKELEGVSEAPLDQRISNAYKKIYYFVQMLQI